MITQEYQMEFTINQDKDDTILDQTIPYKVDAFSIETRRIARKARI